MVVQNYVKYICLLLGVVFPLWALYFILYCSVNISQWDAWDAIIPIVKQDFVQQFHWLDIFNFHNEHRIVLTRFFELLNYRFFSGNNQNILLLGFLAQLIQWLVLFFETKKLSLRYEPILLLVFAALLFAPQSGKIWLWGFIVQQTLTACFFTSAIFAWVHSIQQNKNYFLPLFLAFLTTLSSANGLLIWPTFCLALLLLRVSWQRFFIVSFFSAVVMLLYISGMPHSSSGFSSILHKVGFFFVFLGAPFGWDNVWLSALIGVVGFGFYCYYGYLLLLSQHKPKIMGWFLLALLALGSALLGALGRAQMGVGTALEDRYIPLSVLFWFSVSGMHFFYSEKISYQKWPRFFVILCLIFFLITAFVGTTSLTRTQRELSVMHDALLNQYYIINPRHPVGVNSSVLPVLSFLQKNKLELFHHDQSSYQLGKSIQKYHFQKSHAVLTGKMSVEKLNADTETLRYGFKPALSLSGWVILPTEKIKSILVTDSEDRIIGLGYVNDHPLYRLASKMGLSIKVPWYAFADARYALNTEHEITIFFATVGESPILYRRVNPI